MELKNWMDEGPRFMLDIEAQLQKKLPAWKKKHDELTDEKIQVMKKLDTMEKSIEQAKQQALITITESQAELVQGKASKVRSATGKLQDLKCEQQKLQLQAAKLEAEIAGIESLPGRERRGALLAVMADLSGHVHYRQQAAGDEVRRLEAQEKAQGVIGVSGSVDELLLLQGEPGFPDKKWDDLLKVWQKLTLEKIPAGGVGYRPATGQVFFTHRKIDPLANTQSEKSGEVISGTI